MPSLTQLRLAAREIFDEALRAVDPANAIRNAIRLEGPSLTICDTAFEFPPEAGAFSVAFGKAASTMAHAFDQVLGDRLIEGVLAAPSRASYRWQYFEGGHPLPNEASLAAAKAAFRVLNLASHESGVVIFLISGGGSAMLEWPNNEDITLEDLRSANEMLVTCGASIGEVNAVRRAFSAVKGGRLATHAPNCQQITLIVSDVAKCEDYNVASGPTLMPPTDAPSAAAVVERYDLRRQLPASIIRAIDHPMSPTLGSNRHESFVLLDNDTALEAAAHAALNHGFAAEIAREIRDEPIDLGVEELLTQLANVQDSIARDDRTVCLISGGEFACPVHGDGIGGRNLETALRLAIGFDRNRSSLPPNFVALCGGTDGIDGNSPAAGAIVDNTTIERAKRVGLDARDFVDRSDAYSFFVALGDVVATGPTGTNVRDIRILLASP